MYRFLAILLCLFVVTGIVWGQGSVGTLNGSVVDTTGAVIPGVTVIATNVATGVTNTAETTSVGAYTMPYMPAGTYNIEANSPGFRPARVEGVILRVGQTMTVTVTMEVGAVTEEVTVSAAPPLLESGTAEIGRYLNDEEYHELPLAFTGGTRQLQDFIFQTMPGSTGSPWSGSINGGQRFSHEILIEGIPVGRMDFAGGTNNEMTASAEAIGEFKIHTGAMGAQYNGGQTAVANFNVKSGTNELHGTAFYYHRNEAFHANTYSNNSKGVTKKGNDRLHNYGYSIGGPVFIPKVYNGKNRTFFFTNLDRTTYSTFNDAGFNTTMAHQSFKNGDFSRLLDPAFTGNSSSGTVIGNDALGRPVVFGQLYDPSTTFTAPDGSVLRDPIPGNVIPKNMWSSVSDSVVNEVGITDPDLDKMVRNKAGLSGCCPILKQYIIGVKGDHNINDRHRVSGYYNHQYRNRNNRSGATIAPVPGLPTGNWNNQYTPSRMVRVSWNATIKPTVLNRAAFGYNRFRNANQSVFLGEDWASKIGVQNTSPWHFPRMEFGGNEWQGGNIAPIGSAATNENRNGSWIFQDDLSIIKGGHTFRIGYDYRRYYYDNINNDGSGTFDFRPTATQLPGFSSETGHAFASFLLGAVDHAGRSVHTANFTHRHPSHAIYFMDDWKVTPKLTLNLGMRWEIIEGFYETTTGLMSMVDLNTPNPGAEGRPGAFVWADKFQNTNWKQFGPRFGFAYRVNDKMVVRGGYGITNMPPIRNDWGFGGFTTGQSGSIPISAGTSETGFVDDPSHYLHEPYPNLADPLPNVDPAQQLFTGKQTTAPNSNRLPYTQNWNFTVQYQLPSEFVLEAAYVGSKGTRLWGMSFGDLNALPAEMLSLGDVLRERVSAHPGVKPYDSFPDNRTVAQALRPYPQYTGMREAYPYNSNSSYHSMQLTLNRHFKSGLAIHGSYTFSKSLGMTDNARGGQGIQDVFNRSLEKSETAYHIPHVFRISWIYELPFGQGKRFSTNSWADQIIGGWQFSMIQQYMSGSVIGVGQSGIKRPDGFGSIRPDLVGSDMTLGGAPTDLDFFEGTPYLNPGAFALSPRTGNGVPLRVGTAPQRLPGVRGPHRAAESMRLMKRFRLWENLEFELGGMAVNPFNRHTRGWVSTNISSADFGKLRINGSGQRTIQLEGRIRW